MLILEKKLITKKEKEKYADQMPILDVHQELEANPSYNSTQYTDERASSYEEYYLAFNRGLQEADKKDLDNYLRNIKETETNLKMMNRLVEIYRMMEQNPLVYRALCEIVNEAIQFNNDPESDPVKLVFHKMKFKKLFPAFIDRDEDVANLEDLIIDEFSNVLTLFKFREKGYEYFKRWYVDGKIYFELVFDINDKNSPIKKIVPISPFNIVKIRVKKGDKYEYFYLYDPTQESKRLQKQMGGRYHDFDIGTITRYDGKTSLKTILEQKDTPLLIPEKYILCVESGLKNMQGYPISNLSRSMKLLNSFVMLQDFMMVYRLSRSIEKRFFKISTGDLSPQKVPQFIADVAKQLKQKLVYDHNTGSVLDHKHLTAVSEDIFAPEFGNGQTTDVKNLPGGTALNSIEDVIEFKKELYSSLMVPLSRFFNDNAIVDFGNGANISRDEVTFSKYIQSQRQNFNYLLFKALKVQLMNQKYVKSAEEYEKLEQCFSIIYDNENYYSKMKELEMFNHRLNIYQQMESNIQNGDIDPDWAKKTVLGFSTSDIDDMYLNSAISIRKEREFYQAILDDKLAIADIKGKIQMMEDPNYQLMVVQQEQAENNPDKENKNNKDKKE